MELRFNLKSRAWQLFLVGVFSVPVWNVIGGYVSRPEWQTRTFFGNYLYPILLVLSLLACVGAPFLITLPLSKRFGFAGLGFLAFLVSLVISTFIGLALFGLPIN